MNHVVIPLVGSSQQVVGVLVADEASGQVVEVRAPEASAELVLNYQADHPQDLEDKVDEYLQNTTRCFADYSRKTQADDLVRALEEADRILADGKRVLREEFTEGTKRSMVRDIFNALSSVRVSLKQLPSASLEEAPYRAREAEDRLEAAIRAVETLTHRPLKPRKVHEDANSGTIEDQPQAAVPESKGAELELPVKADGFRGLRLTRSQRERLEDAGINSIAQLSEATDNELLAIKGFGPRTVSRIRQEIRDYSGKQRTRGTRKPQLTVRRGTVVERTRDGGLIEAEESGERLPFDDSSLPKSARREMIKGRQVEFAVEKLPDRSRRAIMIRFFS